MNSISVTWITFAFVFGGAVLGMVLRSILPNDNLNSDSKDVVKLGMGLIATMAALVLGLLIASAKGSFDTQSNELTDMSSRIVLLDRVLAHYGPETKDARDDLRSSVERSLAWASTGDIAEFEPSNKGEGLYDKVQRLSPKDDAQRSMQAQAVNLVMSLGQTRWLMTEQKNNSISVSMLVILIFWLTIIFISFGLYAPRNVTVVVSLFVSAVSVSGAIFLILEMYSPYEGLIHVSTAPLRTALAHLGQ
ncbi:MAG: hypothetical protein ABSB65_17325 [Candidatus Acidiferrales bacterium]